jgi:hypothetical protein
MPSQEPNGSSPETIHYEAEQENQEDQDQTRPEDLPVPLVDTEQILINNLNTPTLS